MPFAKIPSETDIDRMEKKMFDSMKLALWWEMLMRHSQFHRTIAYN